MARPGKRGARQRRLPNCDLQGVGVYTPCVLQPFSFARPLSSCFPLCLCLSSIVRLFILSFISPLVVCSILRKTVDLRDADSTCPGKIMGRGRKIC